MFTSKWMAEDQRSQKQKECGTAAKKAARKYPLPTKVVLDCGRMYARYLLRVAARFRVRAHEQDDSL